MHPKKTERGIKRKRRNMVNVVTALKKLLYVLLRLAGVSQQTIQIDTQTVINFWAPSLSSIKTSKNKPNLLLLHGFCGDGILTWFFQVLYLSRSYAVYVPDLLFFGDSITKRPERSTAFQAECLAKGLKILGVEKCTCVGFSYGGFIGFKLAKMYPELVDAMVVTGALVELTESTSNRALAKLGYQSWSEFLLPKSVEGLKNLLSIGSYRFPWMPDFFYKHFLEVMYTNRKERTELLEALVVKDKEDATLPTYLQRLFLLWGDNDKIFTLEDVSNLQKRCGEKATMQHIGKAGHIFQLERPAVYTSCLKQFMDSTYKTNGNKQG